MSDAVLGKILLIISCLSFCYYTAWVFMLPFTDPDHALNQLFPPVRYALLVPASMGLAFIGTLVVYTVYHIRNARDHQE
jgi:NADH:ubiquinone oxidoreductase subunit 2 (subunit N)